MKHTILITMILTMTRLALGEPVITWASDPVRPDETVLLRGCGFGTQPVVELARIEDGNPMAARQSKVKWIKLPVLQPADDALKFIIPADMKPGVFACRVAAGPYSE